MKKKLAALLCGVMCVTAFTGCSRTELAYLNMSKGLIDTMSSCTVEGSMQADIDFDALQDFEKDMTAAVYGEDYEGVESDYALEGKKSLKVDYDMNMNLDMLEYDMSFDVNYNGKNYDLGKLYYSMNQGVYATSDTLWGMYQIYTDMYGKTDQYIVSDAFAADLKNILAEERYIELVSMEELTGVDMEMMPEQDMAALYDAAFTFYEDVLKGFETGMVKEINGGYQIKADGRQAAQLLADLLHFAADNPEQMLDATEAYMTAVLNSVEAGTPEETAMAKEQMAMIFAEARASQTDFIDAAEQMATLVETMMQDTRVGMLLDSFHYVGTVKERNGMFDSVAAYTVKHEGKTVGSLVTDALMKKADVQILFPEDAMTPEELKDKLAVLENKYNPVTGVTVMWGSYGDNEFADILTRRSVAEGSYFSGDYHWSDMMVEDGRAYLPLRLLAEILGEEVGWESSTKTPFVMKDGERIDMKGKLKDGRAFVGVRDFEKLGYTVEYTFHKDESNDLFSYKEAVITK